jgi:ABC-2 type transport system ATP-binding protein
MSSDLPALDLPALDLRGLSKRFGAVWAVKGVSLRISQGQLYALLGPNGAGKTTILRMVAGLLRPDRGDALVLGSSVGERPAQAKARLAYLPDEPMLYGKLRPGEYLEFVAGLWGVPPEEAAPRARALLERFDLWRHRRDYAETFSRGMKQKLALAGALVHAPKVMILDEPLTGLDAAAARDVKELLIAYVEDGNTVVLTTHIMEVAERLAERIGIISGGSLRAEGTLHELRALSGGEGSLEEVFLDLVERGVEPGVERGVDNGGEERVRA